MKYNPLVDLYNDHQIVFDINTEYYVIGDVHGCDDEYKKLINKINDVTSPEKNAVVIQLGDMIDRGPSFERVLLEDRADYRCMGNHELNFIIEHLQYKPCSSNERKKNHERFAESRNQSELIRTLQNRKSFFWMFDDKGNEYVFSHSPIKDIEMGWKGSRLFGSSTIADFCMRSKSVDVELLRKNNMNISFYHGHQSWHYENIKDQIKSQADYDVRIFNLDSGCVYGEELIAMRLSDKKIFSVKSKIKVARN